MGANVSVLLPGSKIVTGGSVTCCSVVDHLTLRVVEAERLEFDVVQRSARRCSPHEVDHDLLLGQHLGRIAHGRDALDLGRADCCASWPVTAARDADRTTSTRPVAIARLAMTRRRFRVETAGHRPILDADACSHRIPGTVPVTSGREPSCAAEPIVSYAPWRRIHRSSAASSAGRYRLQTRRGAGDHGIVLDAVRRATRPARRGQDHAASVRRRHRGRGPIPVRGPSGRVAHPSQPGRRLRLGRRSHRWGQGAVPRPRAPRRGQPARHARPWTFAHAVAGAGRRSRCVSWPRLHAPSRRRIHFDLKPANLAFGDDRHLRILDVGFSRLVADQTWSDPTSAGIDAARYASPEQAQGRDTERRYGQPLPPTSTRCR